jgi:hypothetical protein
MNAASRGPPARLRHAAAMTTSWRGGNSDDQSQKRHRGYQTALRAGLPEATTVLDSFHAVRLAQQAIDDVRRRVQQETLGHRGRKGDPLYPRPPDPAARRGEPHPARLHPDARRAGHRRPERARHRRLHRRPKTAPPLPPGTWPKPATGSSGSTGPAQPTASVSSNASVAPSPPGKTNCWPTSPPAASATAPPRPSTCRSSASRGDAHGLILGEEYSTEETYLGNGDQMATNLVDLSPEITFLIHQEPRYEFDGDIHIQVPGLGYTPPSATATVTAPQLERSSSSFVRRTQSSTASSHACPSLQVSP